MRKIFLYSLLISLAIVGASTLLFHFFGMEMGHNNFWDKRGLFFLFFVSLFPRLTLLFSSVAFGGIFWWLGFIFVPRWLVAVLATLSYWNENPILVIIAWLVCLSGESSEKVYIRKKVRKYRGQDVIEAQYERVDS
ncbi:MAG: hypothetical protein HOO06_16255 [Bdellovibrionaceae bacterium]|jgi:hypothetical protein|nr:hypothetical protein [Pseudobdellovibrionaceae bacterium]